jgi:serine/threonine-protein kinase HipA
MEAACLRLARAVGLTTVDVTLEIIAGLPCIIVSRFDRRVEDDGTVVRLHQEDACQALGRDPEANRGKGKYEAAGGPTLADLARVLDRWAAEPVVELERLAAAVTFNVVIGNADAHGKNLSTHPAPGMIFLAPLYDTVPTVMWPKLPDPGATHINAKTALPAVTLDDIAAEAARWPLPKGRAHQIAVDTTKNLLDALDSQDVPERLGEFIRNRAQSLLNP